MDELEFDRMQAQTLEELFEIEMSQRKRKRSEELFDEIVRKRSQSNDTEREHWKREHWKELTNAFNEDSKKHLYIMTNSRIQSEFKVGQSKQVETRRYKLSSSQNFCIQLVLVFPDLGVLEKRCTKL